MWSAICRARPTNTSSSARITTISGWAASFLSRPSLTGTVHPGADDNASGTSGVIELARYFAGRPKLHRGIVFMTFAGEELGLLGSGYFVHHPELPLDKAVAMINMDMIGRIQDGRIFIGGTGTGSTLKKDLESVAGNYPISQARLFGDRLRLKRSLLVHFGAGPGAVLFLGTCMPTITSPAIPPTRSTRRMQ